MASQRVNTQILFTRLLAIVELLKAIGSFLKTHLKFHDCLSSSSLSRRPSLREVSLLCSQLFLSRNLLRPTFRHACMCILLYSSTMPLLLLLIAFQSSLYQVARPIQSSLLPQSQFPSRHLFLSRFYTRFPYDPRPCSSSSSFTRASPKFLFRPYQMLPDTIIHGGNFRAIVRKHDEQRANSKWQM